MSFADLSSLSGMDRSWLSGPTCQHVTRTLAHFAWQGCAVAVVFLIANIALQKKSANARYVAGVVTLTILALCPPITFSLLLSWPDQRIITTNVSISTSIAREMVALRNKNDVETSRLNEKAAMQTFHPQIDLASLSRITMADDSFSARTRWLEAVSPYAVVMYLIGIVAMLLRLMIGLWVGQRLRIASFVIFDEPTQRLACDVSSRLAIRVVPLVAYCQRVAVPVVLGVLRPMILLPPALMTGLSIEQLEALLTHEMAHIRRWDLVINLAQRVVEALLFFHPAVWFVSNRINAERENACDDLVLASGWRSLDYATALLRMAEHCALQRRQPINSSALLAASGSRPSQFKQRILRLLGESATPTPRLTRNGFGGLIAIVLMLLLASVVLTLQPDANTRPPKSTADHPNMEDVAMTEELPQSQSEEQQIEFALDLDEPLADVVIEGNSAIPDFDIVKHIKTRPGRPVTQSQIRDDADALVRTRCFASVEPTVRQTNEGAVLVFRVLERPIVRRVEYKGLKRVKKEVFDAMTQLKPGSPFDVNSNRECARRIEECYHEKGFAFATVELEVGNERNDRDVVFLVVEGPKVHVSSIKIEMFKESDDDTLTNIPRTKSRVLSVFGGTYDPTTIKDDIQGVMQYYHSLGYFDVNIKHRLKFSDDKENVEVHYDIDEGIRYKIRNIIVTGITVMTETEIRSTMHVAEDSAYNSRDISRDVDAIKTKYDRQGLLLTRIDAVLCWTANEGMVDLVYRIALAAQLDESSF